MIVLYGIKNCDTVKKARQWLDNKSVAYEFHDFRIDGLTKDKVMLWLNRLGAETLVNKRSTTWKQLTDSDRTKALGSAAADVILAHPTLIKRPLLDTGAALHCGFKGTDYAQLFP